MVCEKCECEKCREYYHDKKELVFSEFPKDIISRFLDFSAPRDKWRWCCVGDILDELEIQRTRSNLTSAGHYISSMNGGGHRRSANKRLTICPPMVTSSKPEKEETL